MCLITDDNNCSSLLFHLRANFICRIWRSKEGAWCLFQKVLLINQGLSYSTFLMSVSSKQSIYSSESSLLPSKLQEKKKHIMSFPKGAEFLPAWNQDPSYLGSFLPPWSRDVGEAWARIRIYWMNGSQGYLGFCRTQLIFVERALALSTGGLFREEIVTWAPGWTSLQSVRVLLWFLPPSFFLLSANIRI